MPESTPEWILKRYLKPFFCLETYQSFFFVLFRQSVSLILQLLDSSLTWRWVAQKRVLLEHYVYFTRLEVRHLTDEVQMREHTQREKIEREIESLRWVGGRTTQRRRTYTTNRSVRVYVLGEARLWWHQGIMHDCACQVLWYLYI